LVCSIGTDIGSTFSQGASDDRENVFAPPHFQGSAALGSLGACRAARPPDLIPEDVN
jgi:hypothetical protein